MIETAALLSALVQKWEDLVIILIMLLVNAGLDFFQEHRALNALAALKAGLANEVIVLRDGVFTTLPVRELVPADVKLLQGNYLSIDQATLTGESLPAPKQAGEVAYANTIVKQGEMLALVVNTGARTAFANVVSLVAKASLEERSQFQKMMIRIGNFLIMITLALVTLIIMVGLFRHESLLDIARFSLVLTVAAIPVALPAVLSVTMAVGALNLARRQAIVSRLSAIEDLAGVDVFCSDKTGTLTRNRMQVAEAVLMDGFDAETLFQMAVLASKRENNDPMELPLFDYLETHFSAGQVVGLPPDPFPSLRSRRQAYRGHRRRIRGDLHGGQGCGPGTAWHDRAAGRPGGACRRPGGSACHAGLPHAGRRSQGR